LAITDPRASGPAQRGSTSSPGSNRAPVAFKQAEARVSSFGKTKRHRHRTLPLRHDGACRDPHKGRRAAVIRAARRAEVTFVNSLRRACFAQFHPQPIAPRRTSLRLYRPLAILLMSTSLAACMGTAPPRNRG
jgi:hypothetical protein